MITTLFLVLLAACSVPSRVKEPNRYTAPVRWVLVEKRLNELRSGTVADQGRMNPESKVLVFEPVMEPPVEIVLPKNGLSDGALELVSLHPSGRVRPGEIVTATIRVVKGKPGQRFRIMAHPVGEGIRVIGNEERVVEGDDKVQFRFTSRVAGCFQVSLHLQRIF